MSPPPESVRRGPASEPPASSANETARIGAVRLEKLRAVASNSAPIAEDEGDELNDRVLLTLVGLFTLYLLLQLVLFQYGRDQGIYAVVGDAMRKGLAPYRDAWDFKPPGIFLIYAVARSISSSMHSVRVLEALGLGSMVGAFCILSRRFVGDPRPGLLGGLFAVLTHVQLEFWHTGQPESFGVVALSWALVCATRPASSVEAASSAASPAMLASWAATGALYVCGALLKPPLGGGFVVSLLFVARSRWLDTPEDAPLAARARRLIEPAVAMAVGALVPLVLTYAYFASKGAWGDLYQTLFVFTPNYTKIGFGKEGIQAQWVIWFMFQAIEQWTFHFSAFNALGIALMLGMPRLSKREIEGAAHIFGVVLFLLLGVALQAKFFPYHFGAALPFAGLLAGWGYWKLWTRARQSLLGVVGVALMVFVLHNARTATRDVANGFWERCMMRNLAVFDPSIRQETNDILHTVADVNAGANRKVAEFITSHTRPGAPVFVWGFEPAIYVLANRPPSSRFNYDVPQRVEWEREASRTTLMADLRKAPPAVLVVEHHDVFPMVTGNNLDSADSLRGFPEMSAFIQDGYQIAESIEDFDIYLPIQH